MTYEQAIADREYLFDTYDCAYDMTGGWVEGDHLEELLKRPTKAHARDILSSLIRYWFESGYQDGDGWVAPDMTDPILVEISERHNPAYIRA